MVTVIGGTNPYAAPEILDFKNPTDRVDIYSLGCVLSFMIAGKSPKQISAEEFHKKCSKRIRKIIFKCTADYSRRYKKISALRHDLEKLLAAKQTELQNYETKIASAEGQISEYAKSIEAQENQIRSIEAEMKRKEEEARKKAEEEKKKAAAANKTTPTYKTVSLGDISFTWPCPASGRITSGFGGRKSPTKGASSNHKGIDISAPTGTSIVAAAAGEVVIATYSSSAGNYVMLSHGGGVYTVYMHASSLLVSQGQSVKKGQTIAKVGSTGYSTGSHLHFGVRVNGAYVNPSKYVSP